MDIVFNVSPLGLEGLGVTPVSLVRHCSEPDRLHLHFLSSGLSTIDKDNVRGLLAREQFNGEISFLDFDADQEFGELRSLHGTARSTAACSFPSAFRRRARCTSTPIWR
jgi:hypothetical protein